MAKQTGKSPVKSSLAERMIALSKSPFAKKLGESFLLKRTDIYFPTNIPMLNLALSGDIRNGLPTGVTTIAAPPKHFKSLFGLHAVEAYLKAEPDGVVIYYDSEFGATSEYFSRFDLDFDRIVHIPITTLEDLKTDLSVKLKSLYADFEKNKKITDKVMFYIDSVGNLPSDKEVEDAENDKQSADFTRAKVIKSIFRIVTTKINMMNIPMLVINHTYQTLEMYSKTVVSGGSGLQYASVNILTITKAQETDNDKQLTGFKFTLVPLMSRYVREKAKMPIYVYFMKELPKYSGLFDIAKEYGLIEPCKVGTKNGWKFTLDPIGDEEPQEFRAINAEIHESEELWGAIFKYTDFEQMLKQNFSVAAHEAPVLIIDKEDLEKYDYDDEDDVAE